ncbi:MAG: diaminopimelate epimerase [Rhodospirillales bacterium]|nr:MAG: diaminopimelate epimerase [Rhodospirillales bacterium]
MIDLAFTKMHGLGNDFVVLDGRAQPLGMTAAMARALADRRTGVGCDQVIVVEPPSDPGAEAFMRIFNADGSEVAACGNATRCVARMLMAESRQDTARIETAAGVLHAAETADGMIRVDMGEARTEWDRIPLAEPMETLHLPVTAGDLSDPVAVSMGNPHAVFFVDDALAVPIETLGPLIEHHPLFPDGTNVGVATVLAPDRIRLRVWERGAGLTRACGTGACAATVAAMRRGFAGPTAEVILDGGSLRIDVTAVGRVHMTGPAAVSFAGRITLARPAA